MAEQSVSIPYAGGAFSDSYWNVDTARMTDDLWIEVRFQNDPDFAIVRVFNFVGGTGTNTVYDNPNVNTLKSKIYPLALHYGSTSESPGYNNSTRKVVLTRFNDTTALMRVGENGQSLTASYLVKVDPSTYEVTFTPAEFTHGLYRFDNNMVEGTKNTLDRDDGSVNNYAYFYNSTWSTTNSSYWTYYNFGSMKNMEDNVIVSFQRYSSRGLQLLDLRLDPSTDVITANCISGYSNSSSGAQSDTFLKFKQNYTNASTGEDFGSSPRYMMGKSNDSNYQQMVHECVDKDDNIWWTWSSGSSSMSRPQFVTVSGREGYHTPCIKYTKGVNNVADVTASVDAAYELYFRAPDDNSSNQYTQFYGAYDSDSDQSAALGSWLPITVGTSGAGVTKWISVGTNKFRVHGDPNAAGALPYLRLSNNQPVGNSDFQGIITQCMWLDDDHFAVMFAYNTSTSSSGASNMQNNIYVNIYKYVDENLIYLVDDSLRPGQKTVHNRNGTMHPMRKVDDYSLMFEGRGVWTLRAPE